MNIIDQIIQLTNRDALPDTDTHAGWERCAAHDRLPAIHGLAVTLRRHLTLRLRDNLDDALHSPV